ncbi:MAG: glycerol-3-phosphate dehydrogenase/oxidase [Halomonadaceae bacterium]|nr:MAG: glycerol-3-phosphate dehydrogenase/oxidase [Halomonadaceae bacterium]
MASRAESLAKLQRGEPWDLIVIGGGITGAGILREACRSGYRVLLVDQQDFTWGTSSRSSKMVHGGLRYLGSGHFNLTRDAVRERERMLNEVPGLVDNLYYLMPHYRKQFPGPRVFGLLLWLYDLIAGRRTRRFYSPAGALRWLPGLRQENLLGATRFSDAITEDSRLVMRLLHEARAQGGEAVNYLAATRVQPDDTGCTVTLDDRLNGATLELRSKAVVNATGAWSDRLREQLGAGRRIRPLRGSHLIVPFWRLPVAASLSLFHPQDRRAMFVFPWEGVTVVGTTDLDHVPDLDREAVIDQQELDYLLQGVNHVFPQAQLTAADIMSTWSGVRPVVSSEKGGNRAPSSESREHAIWDDQGLISVAGGKLTTFRLIAREVLTAAEPYLPPAPHISDLRQPVFSPAPAMQRPATLTARQWRRLQGRYGPMLPAVLTAGEHQGIGGTDTLWAELQWSASQEQVQHLDDLLLRRTRLGLLLPEGAAAWLPAIREQCQLLLGWDDPRWHREEERYLALWRANYSLPPEAPQVPASP